jgi:hypothetical protein
MEIPCRTYEPQREKRYNTTCASCGGESDYGRRREDLVRERNDEIHHAVEEQKFR